MRLVTLAPLPKWRHLISTLLPFTTSDRTLTAPWCRSGDEAFLFSRSAWSLAVVARWWQQLAKKDSLTIWIPDFFCNSSLQPLRDMGARLAFYPVTDQLIPDIDACRTLASKGSPDIVVLVHYFGQPSSVEPMVSFCKEQEAYLVEDAAHLLQPIPGVGEVGDCVLYSPHKHLPISDGAVLVVRQNGPAQLAKKDIEMNVLREICSEVIKSSRISNYLVGSWLIKRILQRLGVRSRTLFASFRAEVNSDVSEIKGFGMSTLAKRLLYNLKGSLDEVASLREQHVMDWQNSLSLLSEFGLFLKPIFSEFTPYLANFTGEQERDTEVLFNKLQHAGLPVLTWPDLPPEVMSNTKVHQSAIKLRHTRLYLPVHQSLNKQLILNYGKNMIGKSTKQWQAKKITLNEWEEHWQRCTKTNLLQSWQYGNAKEEAEGWQPQRFLISNESVEAIALAQVLVKKLPILGGIARLNRGPLMLTTLSVESELAIKFAALSTLLREARRQRWWMMQIAPELPSSEIVHKGLLSMGLRPQTGAAWASGLIDLSLSKSELLAKLNRRWKRALRKVSDFGVTVKLEELTGSRLEEVLDSYTDLQQRNNFNGINSHLIEVLSKLQSKHWACNLFVASRINEESELEELGYRLCIHHGNTVTDFVVSTNEKGRQTEANVALYWYAILHAKSIGCDWFDIGGLSEAATPKGIAEFKKGLNSEPYELTGEWRKYTVPFFSRR
jgi:lipid II:glycine glycyltransferase (peptidoglycan interpeptide bridge formation enzyme)